MKNGGLERVGEGKETRRRIQEEWRKIIQEETDLAEWNRGEWSGW
jgi:hypothetical protein